MSATRGHQNNQGSLLLTENVFNTFESVHASIDYLKIHTEGETLKFYLEKRAQKLQLQDSTNLLLARFSLLMRLTTPEDGVLISEAYQKMPIENQALIESQFSPLMMRNERTPTYIPAFLMNLLSYYKVILDHKEAKIKTFQEGLLFVGTVLRDFRGKKANQPFNPNLSLNFNDVANMIKGFSDGKTFSYEEDYMIDEKGVVLFKKE